jgi:hypothetical protein
VERRSWSQCRAVRWCRRRNGSHNEFLVICIVSVSADNLADSEPEITAELKALADDWRAGIEKRWETEYSELDHEYISHGMV